MGPAPAEGVCSRPGASRKRTCYGAPPHGGEAEHLAEAMHERLQGAEARARLKARKGSVEPVIGNLKANLGFRRFSLRGLKQVKGELYLMAIGHNLNTLFKMAQGGAFFASYTRLIAFFGHWRLRQPASRRRGAHNGRVSVRILQSFTRTWHLDYA